MGKKRKRAQVDLQEELAPVEQLADDNSPNEDEQVVETKVVAAQPIEDTQEAAAQQQHNLDPRANPVEKTKERERRQFKQSYSRVDVDPGRRYNTPQSRESWGPNVKGKKFRKEKGKKKRCGNAGIRIDGSVNSVRLDA